MSQKMPEYAKKYKLCLDIIQCKKHQNNYIKIIVMCNTYSVGGTLWILENHV